MSDPIRILHWGMHNNIGGVETFLINVYRHIDRNKIQFDFLIDFDGEIAFEDEIINMGGCIHRVLYPKKKSLIKHYYTLNKFFKSNPNYNGLHMHLNNSNFIIPLKYAKKYNIPIRIAHSHNAGNMIVDKKVINILSNLNRKKLIKYTTNRLACSNLAGSWMFEQDDFQVINNGIVTKEFLYNSEIRLKKLNELNLVGKKVIGTIGRLQYQKNPEFVLEVFKEIHKRDKDTVLLMIGQGPLEFKIKELISKYKLNNAVYLLGMKKKVSDYLQVFDLFLLPSRFEGLGIVLIEAQASGLPCLTSKDVVPLEAKVTNLLTYIDLNMGAEYWADIALRKLGIERENRYDEILSAGYDISNTVNLLENIYLNKDNH